MNSAAQDNLKGKIRIIPHTHWDREWYKTFQEFRIKLVELVDVLIDYCEKEDYTFLLDGQTIVLEDYLEIRPEKKEKLVSLIREGKIVVGPWYLLPDEWLVGGESIIRNLELSHNLAQELNIPLMKVAYLPDQFGHSAAIPQIICDLTSIRCAMVWRGVGDEITTGLFKWKRNESSERSLLTQYLAYSYSNGATLPHNIEDFKQVILEKISEWKSYMQLPLYLIMNGTDHQFPDFAVHKMVKLLRKEGWDIKLCSLEEYFNDVQKLLKTNKQSLPYYSGEFRSSKRAPLLQDTYSSRIWIKQLNQEIEDLLVKNAEPLYSYLFLLKQEPYPYTLLQLAWKWLLKNQPHDSICGCSIDQVHEEMKARFSWAMNIAKTLVEIGIDKLNTSQVNKKELILVVFLAANGVNPCYLEFELPEKVAVTGIKDTKGNYYPIQRLSSCEEIFYNAIMGPMKLKAGLKLLPGRQISNIFINDVVVKRNPINPKICDINIICDEEPIGDFDIRALKEEALEIIKSKQYEKFNVVIKKRGKQKYCTLIPVEGWKFNSYQFVENKHPLLEKQSTVITKNSFDNKFFHIKFNKDGTFDLFDKQTGTQYLKLHCFEDLGDRGDEYTFSGVKPEKSKVKKIRRIVTEKGPIVYEIKQELELEVFEQLAENREKRVGKTIIPVATQFRFYSNIPRIDIKTSLLNTAKDHRLRVIFPLPFKAEESFTSTHFGYIKRSTKVPICEEDYEECPSGIQPQKRFIRVDRPDGNSSFVLFNKGLPEVEVVNGNAVALTLLRSVGYLSRGDLPERPSPAGPVLETPKAQMFQETMTFEYALYFQKSKDDISMTFDAAEAFTIKPLSCISFSHVGNWNKEAIIKFDNNQIKISSLRVVDDRIVVTSFNISNKMVKTLAFIHPNVKDVNRVNLEKTEIERINVEKTDDSKFLRLRFDPHEIKMLSLRIIKIKK